MKKLLLLACSLITGNAFAEMNHNDITNAMKANRASNEVMSISPHAHAIPIKNLIPKKKQDELNKAKENRKQKKLKEEAKKGAETLPKSFFFSSAYAFAPVKPVPTPEPIPTLSPTKVSLRANDTPIQNQWNGTCTAHATVGAIENLLKHQVKLSERYHWYTYQQYSSEASVAAAQTKPIVMNDKWPHDKVNPPGLTSGGSKVKLTGVDYFGDDVNLLQAHLKKGLPAIVAMTVPKDLLTCMTVVREQTIMDTQSGHAMAVVGFGLDSSLRGGGYFEVKNSWSANCGDQGYQYIPFSVCDKPDSYCMFWGFKEVAKM